MALRTETGGVQADEQPIDHLIRAATSLEELKVGLTLLLTPDLDWTELEEHTGLSLERVEFGLVRFRARRP